MPCSSYAYVRTRTYIQPARGERRGGWKLEGRKETNHMTKFVGPACPPARWEVRGEVDGAK